MTILLGLIAAVTAVTSVRDTYPSLSPDGSRLVFGSNRSGAQAIWTAQPDGSQPRLLFDGARLGSDPVTPVWSPDGKTILFAMKPAGATDPNESDIFVMDIAGANVLRLTNAAGDDSHPHWSADGRRIFFNSARATPDLAADWSRQWIDIYSMAVTGSDVRRHTECRNVCTYPVPSPDGRYVVHRCTVETSAVNWDQTPTMRNSEVCVTSIQDGSRRNITRSTAYDGWPTWSADGRWIVFSSNRDGVPNSGQIYRMHPDGTGLERVTSGPFSHAQPSFAGTTTLYVYKEMESGDFEVGGIARVDMSDRDRRNAP